MNERPLVPGPGQSRAIVDSLEASVVDLAGVLHRDSLLEGRAAAAAGVEPPD